MSSATLSIKAAPRRSNLGYERVFRQGRLTLGFIAPLEAYPDSPFPTLAEHARLARKIDESGFAALWMRDVPFFDPTFGDAGQILDPFVYAGYLAAATQRIALGTAGVVLPLRDPLIVAKQAASVDQLTGGRFVLGLSSGDRSAEYPAFGVDYANRADRFREAFELIAKVLEADFPQVQTRHYGTLDGALDLIPKPVRAMPMIVIGQARQDPAWIGANADAWIGHLSDFTRLPDKLRAWRESGEDGRFRPYGYGSFFELAADPGAPLQHIGNRFRIGRNRLTDLLKDQERQGVNHVALNLKPQRRPAEEVIQELAEFVLPHFPSDDG
ncbi:LLM class oxidoreductase [Caulobacter sp.]|uniref:LLM class oxidoreductase n=1 Tax=Caulobacter sp. TaxID=78 RepID=UPI0031D0F196